MENSAKNSKNCFRATFTGLMLFVGVCLPFNARAELAGSLFTSPEERAYLDYLREDFLTRNASAGFTIDETDLLVIPDQVDEPELETPVEYRLGGVMTRRDGTRALWLNNAQIAEADLPTNFRLVNAGGGLALLISDQGRDFLIKPGQKVDLGSGDIQEAFQFSQPVIEELATEVSESDEVVIEEPEQTDTPDSTDIAVVAEALTTLLADNELLENLDIEDEANAANNPNRPITENETEFEPSPSQLLQIRQSLQELGLP